MRARIKTERIAYATNGRRRRLRKSGRTRRQFRRMRITVIPFVLNKVIKVRSVYEDTKVINASLIGDVTFSRSPRPASFSLYSVVFRRRSCRVGNAAEKRRHYEDDPESPGIKGDSFAASRRLGHDELCARQRRTEVVDGGRYLTHPLSSIPY